MSDIESTQTQRIELQITIAAMSIQYSYSTILSLLFVCRGLHARTKVDSGQNIHVIHNPIGRTSALSGNIQYDSDCSAPAIKMCMCLSSHRRGDSVSGRTEPSKLRCGKIATQHIYMSPKSRIMRA